jgi:acyl-coenzyme A thioesterase PaaI-like protein
MVSLAIATGLSGLLIGGTAATLAELIAALAVRRAR